MEAGWWMPWRQAWSWGGFSPPGVSPDGAGAWELAAPVVLTQSDIRELQLAKGAIAAGIRMLLDRFGASAGDLKKLYLAGAFGNYINRASAQRIGLISFPSEKVEAAGNTALLGAKLALFLPEGEDGSFARLRQSNRACGAERRSRFSRYLCGGNGISKHGCWGLGTGGW